MTKLLKLLQEWAEMQRLELSKSLQKIKPENKQLLFPNINNELMHPSKTSK